MAGTRVVRVNLWRATSVLKPTASPRQRITADVARAQAETVPRINMFRIVWASGVPWRSWATGGSVSTVTRPGHRRLCWLWTAPFGRPEVPDV